MPENEPGKNTINVFIPAAGLGERLQPLTHHIPKPLIPLAGKPALQYVLDNIAALPLDTIGVNVFHKKEAVERWLARCALKDKITVFREESILGTGGALKNAGDMLKRKAFLVHNSDIISDMDLTKLLESHRASKNIATLAVHDFPEFNTVVTDGEGYFTGIDRNPSSSDGKCAFTGIAVYEPEFLGYLPGGASSVVDAWMRAVRGGNRIGTYNVSGCCWSDIGTPSSYASAVFHVLKSGGETVFIHPSAEKCADLEYRGNVVIEDDSVVAAGTYLRNCIILPGSRTGTVHEPHPFENCIIGPGLRIDLHEEDILPFEDNGQLIGTGGSDRKYVRVRHDGGFAVRMKCGKDDPDYERHIEYTRFFLKHSVPVPALIGTDNDKKEAVFEDAGDISLYSFLKCPRKEIKSIYRRIIDVMALMHTHVSEHVSECPLLRRRIFDYEYFRWETDYFNERFVGGLRNISVENIPELRNEFHELASKADSFPKAVIHRDLQSQNIMIAENRQIRLIDFQGARVGPPAYDCASVLWDPYCRLDDAMRERLLEYYIQRVNTLAVDEFSEPLFRESMLSCRLQRHMQALGAYGYLSSVKGKKYFLKYVPEGVRLLKEEISLAKDEYPELFKLVMRL